MKEQTSLRIAMLGHKRIPSREGGIEIVVQELSKRMVRLGHHVTCLNRGGHHVSGKENKTYHGDEYLGIKLISVATIDRKGLAAITASISGAFKAAFGKFDIVHFHAEGPCAMLWLPKLFSKKCVATIHGLDHRRAKWGKLASAYIMMGERCAAKYADEIIVLSEDVRQYFRDTYGRDTVYIPNGVNRPTKREADIIHKKFGLQKDSYILFLGRIVPEKGLITLIEAYKEVATDKKLVIAGGTSDTEGFVLKLKQMAAEDARIVFTGFVQDRMLDELYSNAYVYCLPSELEGMPLSLLEAMSYGNCCLVSDIGECTSVVEDHAMVCKTGNVAELRHMLQTACDDPQRVGQFKISSADYICNKYNWDTSTEQTMDVYYKLQAQ